MFWKILLDRVRSCSHRTEPCGAAPLRKLYSKARTILYTQQTDSTHDTFYLLHTYLIRLLFIMKANFA